MKDPNETNKYLVRRLAALEGSEMVSSDEKDEPFVLEKDQCWVVAENQEMKSKVHCYIGRRKKALLLNLCFTLVCFYSLYRAVGFYRKHMIVERLVRFQWQT